MNVKDAEEYIFELARKMADDENKRSMQEAQKRAYSNALLSRSNSLLSAQSANPARTSYVTASTSMDSRYAEEYVAQAIANMPVEEVLELIGEERLNEYLRSKL